MKLQKFVTVGTVAVLVLQLSACFEATLGTIGAGVGGILGDKVAEHAGMFRPLIAGVGAMVGAELGRRLGKYLDEQDQQKLQQQVNVQVQSPQPQVSVACTGEQSAYRSVSIQEAQNESCGDKNKVILSTTASSLVGNQECKSMKAEVMNAQGSLDTMTDQICKGPDGAWHPKSV